MLIEDITSLVDNAICYYNFSIFNIKVLYFLNKFLMFDIKKT